MGWKSAQGFALPDGNFVGEARVVNEDAYIYLSEIRVLGGTSGVANFDVFSDAPVLNGGQIIVLIDADTFSGRAVEDTLSGWFGDDRLNGDIDEDTLHGKNDDDNLHSDDNFYAGKGINIVKDFANKIDKIVLDNFDFGSDGMLTIEDTTIGRLQNDLILV